MIGRDALREVARVHIEEMWGQGREALAAELYAEDVVDHQPAPGQRLGVAGILDVLRGLRRSIPDLTLEVHDYVIEPPFASDRWTLTGTHTGAPFADLPAKGLAVRFHGGDVIKVRGDGRITDIWHVEEFWRLREQVAGRMGA